MLNFREKEEDLFHGGASISPSTFVSITVVYTIKTPFVPSLPSVAPNH